MDGFSKGLQSLGGKLSAAAASAKDAAEKAAAGAREAARVAGADAKAAGSALQRSAAAGFAGAGSLVGSVVTVGGRALYVESKIAEGGFGSVYAALPADAATGAPTPGAAKVVLKRMFAGVRFAGGALLGRARAGAGGAWQRLSRAAAPASVCSLSISSRRGRIRAPL